MEWAGSARPFSSNMGSPQKREAFVGRFRAGGATHFCDQTKVGKNWLRTCGSKDSLLPADLPSSITGAWGSKGLLHLPRALRPPAAEHASFLSL